ncbi:hypothetical protein [Bacillus luti]
MAWFVMTVWNVTFKKDDEMEWIEQEREARRIERMEMIKDMK